MPAGVTMRRMGRAVPARFCPYCGMGVLGVRRMKRVFLMGDAGGVMVEVVNERQAAETIRTLKRRGFREVTEDEFQDARRMQRRTREVRTVRGDA